MTTGDISLEDLLQRRKKLRRTLCAAEGLQPVRIAVLGGATTQELVEMLEVLLLASGFRPVFHQSGFGRFHEDAVLDPAELIAFAPDIVYVCTSSRNLRHLPGAHCSAEEFGRLVDLEVDHYRRIWNAVEQNVSAQIVQNNFELPSLAPLGNLEASSYVGASRFVLAVNAQFADAAAANQRLLLQDNHRLSAELGLGRWHDSARYFAYKIPLTPEANAAVARSVASIVRALYGLSSKVLVLDLDNTLWGGIIGEDGPEHIQIGRETPVAEAYTAFQDYCLSLRTRGVLLAVCSKNDPDVARSGFEHPDSVLRLEDFAAFHANWNPKHENIQAIARELNLSVDSLVFVDDNPAERAIIAAQVPGVAVPDVGDDVSRFAAAIEQGRYFEAVTLSPDDLARASSYRANAQRTQSAAAFADYGEYLDFLEMTAEIDSFNPTYVPRIAQLTNKTNQFNLTTRRCTVVEIERMKDDPSCIALYGRLADRFGDNGVVSVVVGRQVDRALHLDLWLMSCRVLKRDMECAMLDAVVERARQRNIGSLLGYFRPTRKNGIVADHYSKLGFTLVHHDSATGESTWSLDLSTYTPRNRHIKVLESVRA